MVLGPRDTTGESPFRILFQCFIGSGNGGKTPAAGRVTKWCVDLDAPARKVKTPAFAAFDSQQARLQ